MKKMTTVKSGEPIGSLGSSEKNKQWQRELLMERLRSHSSQHKSFQELSRAMRMSMLEKRYALDAVEKSNLQKCLDSMQHCIKVKTRQGLVERLESLSRQLGLKFMEDTSGLFISSDMFYLEIILDADGTLSDVKVHHECKIEQQSCSELVQCLLNGDFADFTIQLEGLSSIYQLNAEPKVKSKAFVALQAMETDLYNLFTTQNFHKDTYALMMDSIVGIVQKRRGGHSMKLIYFISPYDLLNLDTMSMQSLTLDVISTTTRNIGMSVSVNLEASSANKLQILPTVTFNKDMQGDNVPIYSSMNTINSTLLPATFVLRLNTPLPVCKLLMSTLTHLNDSTNTNNTNNNLNTNDSSKLSPIMDLIVQTVSDGQMKTSSKGLPVILPDQSHVYYFTENKSLRGSVVTSIPFTEPSQVPKIISVLRKQALFHTLLASCVRSQSRITDIEKTTILEVDVISITQISVSLEHPYEESMATIEFDISDGKNILCSIYSLNNSYDAVAIKLTKIAQKTLSIPITIRALLKFWEQERLKGYHHRGMENGNFNLSLGPNDPGGGRNNNNGPGNSCSGPDFRDIKIKTERGGSNGTSGLSGLNNSNCGGADTNFNGIGNIGGGNNNRQFFSGGLSDNTFSTVRNNLSIFEHTSVGTADSSNNGTRISHNQFGNDFQDQFRSNMMSGGIVTGFSTTGEDFYKSPKSVFCNNNSLSETSGDSNSLGAATQSTSDTGVTAITTKNFQKVFEKDSISNGNSFSNSNADKNKSSDRQKNLKDVEKIEEKDPLSTPLNITSMSANELTSVLSGMGLEKRPGIEIIPISSSSNHSFQTSITITPISVSASSSSSKSNKKHSSSSGTSSTSTKKADDKLKNDKKRKRKKDDISSGSGGQMGPPPEKQISKLSDSFNRTPVGTLNASSSTFKKDMSSVFSNRSNKHPSLPMGGMMVSNNNNSSNTSTKPTSKHSPTSYTSVSPKSQQSVSPKHSLSGSSSGKPSMLALKTATNSSSSPKSDKASLKSQTFSSKDKSDRERSNDRAVRNLSSTSSISPKIKSSTVKLKQIDLSAAFLHHLESGAGNTTTNDDDSVFSHQISGSGNDVSSVSPTSGNNLGSIGAGNQPKVRKGSLSAVIDKLKSAQNSGDENASIGDDPLLLSDNSINNSKLSTTSTSLSEYMIKPSLDGMKITINKTRAKDISTPSTQKISSPPVNTSSSSFKFSSSSSFNSGNSSSLKRQSNLKSNISQSGGLSSKKSIVASLLKSTNHSSSSSPLPNSSGTSNNSFQTGKSSFQRTNSSGSLAPTKSGSSSGSNSGSASDLYRKEKPKINKSGNGGGTDAVKQIGNRADPVDVMKILRMTSPNNSMDGFMKSLDTKFQIPKLSARTNDDSKKDPSVAKQTVSPSSTTLQSTTTTTTITTTSSNTSTLTSSQSISSSVSISSGSNPLNNDPLKDFSALAKTQQSTSNSNQQQQIGNIHQNISATSTIGVSRISPGHFPSPSTSPKCRSNDSSGFLKDHVASSQLSKSSSSDAILNTFRQRDYIIKPHSTSTPSTPIHVQSPFTSPVGASTTVCKTSPSISPNIGANTTGGGILRNDVLTMRPPSAPCVIDMTKCVSNEADISGGIKSAGPVATATIAAAAATTPSGSVPVKKVISTTTSQNTVTTSAVASTSSSSSSSHNNKMPIHPSSSVSIHIVKSPVPSPLMQLLPSPHSNSSCITDEEMIDESLIGIKGK